jgi:4-amino-4-deoxy-L-arabinose transferase-like glycosyltransferase
MFSSLIIGYGLLMVFNLLRNLSRIEAFVFSFALGIGFTSFVVFFLGLLHILYLKWVLLILILASVISLKSAYQQLRNIKFPFHDFKYLYSNKLYAFLVILIFLSLLLTFIGAIAPATGNDALIYHLSDAKYFAQHHKLTFIPYTSSSIFPYFMEMLFTLAMLFENPPLAKLFHFSMAFFGGLAVYSLGRRYINKEVAILAAAIFYLTPGVFTQATYAYIDIGWAFYTFMGFYAIMLWDFSSERRWLVLAGVMCGFAADTKYIGLITPVTVGLVLIIKGFLQKEKYKELARNFALFSIIVVIIIFPYYIRPFLYTGNPFYPFYAKYIAESGWYGHSGFDFGMKKTLLNFIISPWYVTYYPGKIFGGDESQISPICLAFLPALLFLKRKCRPVLIISIFAGIFYFFWFFKFPAVRYLLPNIPFLALLSGYIVWSINDWSRKLGGLTKVVFVVFLIINFGLCMYYNKEEMAFFLRGANVDRYLAKQDRSSAVYQYINKNTPSTSKILLLGEIRTLYLDRENIREIYYRIYDKYHLKDIIEIIDDLKSKGITHILYAETENNEADNKPASVTDNRFTALIRDSNFVSKYLDKVVEMNYSYSPLRIRHMLYRLK